ncbi:MAG TPA: transcriptional regulator [Streptosporangiaceae bacterium]|nr:transcriptional regulator [Streptosporangiaceae bacterium]
MDQRNPGLSAVSSLDDPVRGRLYRVVAASTRPVGRDEAAAAASVGRPLAAYHLDKLVELGLLDASYQRPPGRGGPGAGRPAKVYARSGREFAVSVPPRDYELAARLLAAAVAADASGTSQAALRDAARKYGVDAGRRRRPAGDGLSDGRQALQALLREHGFEPWQDQDGAMYLRNCPFHRLASGYPELVCGMTIALIGGMVDGLQASDIRPDLVAGPGRCCVVIANAGDGTGVDLAPARRADRD